MTEMEAITMQDVRLVAGEGKLAAHHVLDAVNIILRQRAERSGPAQSSTGTEELRRGTCSAYIAANGIYGPCRNGFPQMGGCNPPRADSTVIPPCCREEWCGERYDRWGGKPPLPTLESSHGG